MIPSCCWLRPRRLGVAVELGRMWCVGNGHLRFERFSRQQRQSSTAQSGCPCVEAGATTGQTTAGGSIRRRRRRQTERRRAGKRRIELSLCDIFCSSDHNHKREEHVVFGTGEKGNPLGWSGNESTRQGEGRLGQGDEAATENVSRTARGDHDRLLIAHHHESSNHRFFLF